MTALHRVLGDFYDARSDDFAYGALFGGAVVGAALGLAIWMDKSSATSERRQTTADHQRGRDISR